MTAYRKLSGHLGTPHSRAAWAGLLLCGAVMGCCAFYARRRLRERAGRRLREREAAGGNAGLPAGSGPDAGAGGRSASRRELPASPADLLSRELLVDRLERALDHAPRTHGGATVIVFRIDDFGEIDSSLGRAVGDHVQSVIGLRLRERLRPEDALARIGRGEFAVLLENEPGTGAAARVAERISESLNAPLSIDDRMLYVTVGAGLAQREEALEGERAAEELIRAAAQDARESRHETTGRPAPETGLERLKLESELRRAIEYGELTLHYQPQVVLETGEVAGLEALLRWEHPRRGTVPPEEFIAFSETTGLVVPMGLWALGEACRAATTWRDRAGGRQIFVSVNLSAKQFQQPELADGISEVVESTGVEPGSLILEITESLLLDDTQQVTETLQRIKSLGVKLALDDFGTGYSSLSYLERIPVDFLKIDRSFVSRLSGDRQDTAVLLAAILGAAETLGIRTIAEGLETAAQLETLKGLRCEMGQGYYYSGPLPLEEASRLVGASLPVVEPAADAE